MNLGVFRAMTNPGDITVRPATSSRDMHRFIRFPLEHYRGDPNFVPHLLWERKQFFDPDQNPLFHFTEVQYFLAWRNDEIVGRVTAHINHRHNEYWDERAGCFGFFESTPDPAVSRVLMNRAESWLRERDIHVVRGPFNFSTNEECGLLVEGFDSPPAIMMPYTKRYYPRMMENLGYEKARDLLAFDYSYQGAVPPYLVRFSQKLRKRTGVNVRRLDMGDFQAEIQKALQVYNEAWGKNWGFVPMTTEQFRHMARDLRPIIDPEVALIAEKDGRPVGFSLSLPDYNQLLRRVNGCLLPFGWAHLLLGRNTIDRIRVITLGVIEEFRNRGIDVLFYHDTFQNGLARGYWGCEMSWILEDNRLMVRAMKRMGARIYKRYRIYEKEL